MLKILPAIHYGKRAYYAYVNNIHVVTGKTKISATEMSMKLMRSFSIHDWDVYLTHRGSGFSHRESIKLMEYGSLD